MITVPTPAACAWAPMPAAVPSADLDTYQIHITVVSNGESPAELGRGGLATGAGLRILIGPAAFERGPPGSATVKRPERASSGTVTLKTAPRWRTSAVTRRRERCTFDLRGNVATIPRLKPRPHSWSLPPGWTVIGLPSAQRRTQPICVIRGGLGARRCLAAAVAGTHSSRASAVMSTVRRAISPGRVLTGERGRGCAFFVQP